MRPTGTTVIIEDVAFPVERLAEATLDLQQLLQAHGYPEAIIFGHALEGNLHFVFTQDFSSGRRGRALPRASWTPCARWSCDKYDGSLKAEHGTGRNMAPFVEMEWGAQAYALMRRIKALFDPQGLLNPGVILNDDPQAHLKNLKPLPAADALVDKCIECGFCEPKCPSRGLTLSPRQRIVGWREIARLERRRGCQPERAAELQAALRLPRHRHLRRLRPVRHGLPGGHRDRPADQGAARARAPVRWRRKVAARRRAALRRRHRRRAARPGRRRPAARRGRHRRDEGRARRPAQGVRRAAAEVVAGAGAAGALRAAAQRHAAPAPSASSISPAAPRATWARSAATTAATRCRRVAERLFRKAGFDVVYPRRLAGLCCGQPFESKGLHGRGRREVGRARSARCARPAKAAAGRSSSTPAPAPTA